MTNSYLRNALIAAGIVAALGVAGCGETTNQSSNQAGATQEVSDAAITAGVKSKLAMAGDLESSDINVTTSNGTVTLTGSVNDTTSRSAAETAARSFAGVTDVDNRLSVSSAGTGTAANSMGSAARSTGEAVMETGDAAADAVSDTWITTKVKSVLLADSEAKGLDIEVDTKDGVVTLKGELTSQAAVDHVKALASDVEGVKRVNFSALTVARR